MDNVREAPPFNNLPDELDLNRKIPTCDQCKEICFASVYPTSNRFVIRQPLRRCCFDTFRNLEPNLRTITWLTLAAYFDEDTLSKLLAIMKNVHSLQIPKNSSELLSPILTLSYFEVESLYLYGRSSALMDFPSRALRVRQIYVNKVWWFREYIEQHQQVINYIEVDFSQEASVEMAREAMKSQGFTVQTIGGEGNEVLKAFK
jgi:hypothetical protein